MSGPSDERSKSGGSPGFDEFADPLDDQSLSEQIDEDVSNSGNAFADY
jgi:hypothetical protein